MGLYFGLDIGGSHLSMGVVGKREKTLNLVRKWDIPIDSGLSTDCFLEIISSNILQFLEERNTFQLEGIGISIPGPFLYDHGISKMYGQNKYDNIFGLDVGRSLLNRLNKKVSVESGNIGFINDAQAFLLGAMDINNWNKYSNILGITLGTGLGSAFYGEGEFKTKDVPHDGVLFNAPFKKGIAEDYLSADWLVNRYNKTQPEYEISNVKQLAGRCREDRKAKTVFEEFGANLGQFLTSVIKDFKPGHLVFGGNVSKAFPHFRDAFIENFNGDGKKIMLSINENTSAAAILGAVKNILHKKKGAVNARQIRESVNAVMPVNKISGGKSNSYDIYPTYNVQGQFIKTNFEELAQWIKGEDTVVIDGYVGVDWKGITSKMDKELCRKGIEANWYSIEAAWKDEKEINEMLKPYLGGDDPVFGHLYPGDMVDFFDEEKLKRIPTDSEGTSIIYGSGAYFADPEASLLYVDIPKNEIQYRSRAGNARNIGSLEDIPPKEQYKRFYFVDWVVLNKHKKKLLSEIDVIVDGQHTGDISWMEGANFRNALDSITQNVFRVRPWFEPGIWGGQWMKKNIEGLNEDAVNYAWSFECIVPENGIVIESDSRLLEFSFDFLMYYDNRAVLGKHSNIFGDEFPVRFDFLDTMEGDNLSLQCHPTEAYMEKHFGENYTQDETYYIFEASEDASVFLGFQGDINSDKFRNELMESHQNNSPVPVDEYVQTVQSSKHDFFLIPAGTVHCSGKGNLVLEISSTPYIYTFKMYDWLRVDLDGNPRPININRAFENLNFQRKGEKVTRELISTPSVIEEGSDWRIMHLPTHARHFYDVHRLEFDGLIKISTDNKFQILNLVEGSSIIVKTKDREQKIHYAETFIIPAAAKSYTLINKGNSRAKVVKAFVKDDVDL